MGDANHSEFAYIDWLRRRTPPSHSGVLIGLGDDCAAVRFAPDRAGLVTTDMLLEGSCFILAEAGAQRIGRKAMSVNLSDIAAMAGIPRYAVVSLGLPRQKGRETAEELYLGMREVADAFDTAVIGGDTNTWDGPLAISITLIGEATPGGPVRRSAAQVGDSIFVTGALGGSILGKHLDFTPRIREAWALRDRVELHAMIDVSDGFAADLYHICEESRCGASIRADSIPISAAARTQSERDGKSPLEHALGDGEDFELLFTVAPADGAKLRSDGSIAGIPVHHVGEIVESGVWLELGAQRRELPRMGYVHKMGD